MGVLSGRRLVTDGGLETDLIFHRGVDLPEFAAFPLLADDGGRALLRSYYDDYAAVARSAGADLLLESPTWRATADWGVALGFDAAALRELNTAAVRFLQDLRDAYAAAPSGVGTVLVSGQVGPRGDGYRPGAQLDPEEAAEYHRPQLAAFADAGADLAGALTITGVDEARGIVRAARQVGLPVGIGFTVETDGRLPDGTTLADAIRAVDATDGPDHFVINCAHPTHIARALDDDAGGDWTDRVVGLRANASTLSHAELDEAEELDDDDPPAFAADHAVLRTAFPALAVLGGCCGTDVRHVAAVWNVPAPSAPGPAG